MKRQALGKGLGALLPKSATPSPFLEIDILSIRPNSFQPRLQFEPSTLEELAASIAENGILQPLVVRPHPEGYELIAGERRWRAAQKAGLQKVPAIVHQVSDQRVLEIALVENIQREDLSAIEEAQAYQLLVDEFRLTQEEVAKRVGRSRAAVTNTLRLLKLPRPIQDALLTHQLSMGHARALLPLPKKEQLALAAEITAKELSVREVERRVQRLLQPPETRAPKAPDPNVRAAEQTLEQALKTRVHIRRRGQAGQIVIHYHSEEELQRLYSRLT